MKYLMKAMVLILLVTNMCFAQKPYWIKHAQRDAADPNQNRFNHGDHLIIGDFSPSIIINGVPRTHDEILRVQPGRAAHWQVLKFVKVYLGWGVPGYFTWPTVYPSYSNAIAEGYNFMDQGSIDPWAVSFDDQYIVGNFVGDEFDELLAVNPNGKYHTMEWNRTFGGWNTLGRGSNGLILIDDQYLTGDFDGDGYDELLAIYSDGWSRTMEFDGVDWNVIEDNAGSGSIKWWILRPDDKYVIGDFNNDGKDELFAINPNGWYHLMAFNDQTMSWDYLLGGSNGLLDLWNIAAGDDYLAGDFDCSGADQLMVFSSNNTSQTFNLDHNNTTGWSWSHISNSIVNNGVIGEWQAQQISGWSIDSNEKRLVGKFEYLENSIPDCDGIVSIKANSDWSLLLHY